AHAIGAKEQLEPKIAALARGLDQLDKTAPAGNTAADRMQELARISTEAQELVNSIQVQKVEKGERIVLAGPLVEASWLSNQDRLKTVTQFTLSNTSLGDEVFPLLA